MKINEKHLEFVQNNITRMSQCSFQMKGWSLALYFISDNYHFFVLVLRFDVSIERKKVYRYLQ